MKRIEDIIEKNRVDFNDLEPDSGHLDRFQDKLEIFQQDAHESFYERYNIVLKIAAAVILFAAVSALYLTDTFTSLKDSITDQIATTELPEEIQEVMLYYNIITDKKVEQIDELAVSEDEAKRIRELAMLELKNLADDRLELEEEYSKNPNNERILNALTVNQRKKSEILDKILNTLNQIN